MSVARATAAAWLVTSMLCACATTARDAAAPATAGDAARPAQTAGWMRSELYFAVGNEDGSGAIDESR